MTGDNLGATPPPPVRTKPNKAYGAFAVSFIVLLAQALDPAAKSHPVTWQEWLIVVLGAGATAYTTWQITNPAKNTRRGARGARGEAGATTMDPLAVIGAVVALAGLLLLLATVYDAIGIVVLIVGLILLVLGFTRGRHRPV